MVRLVVTLLFSMFGSGFVCFVGAWRIGPGRFMGVSVDCQRCRGLPSAHFFVVSAAESGFQWDSRVLGCERPGLPVLSNWAGPSQLLGLRFWRLGGMRYPQTCVLGRAFAEALFLDISGTLQLLTSGHVRERDKALLRSVLAGRRERRGGMGFLLEKVKGQHVPCRFCGGADNDGHLFWDCPFPPPVEIREHPEFHGLLEMDKSHWPWCLL